MFNFLRWIFRRKTKHYEVIGRTADGRMLLKEVMESEWTIKQTGEQNGD